MIHYLYIYICIYILHISYIPIAMICLYIYVIYIYIYIYSTYEYSQCPTSGPNLFLKYDLLSAVWSPREFPEAAHRANESPTPAIWEDRGTFEAKNPRGSDSQALAGYHDNNCSGSYSLYKLLSAGSPEERDQKNLPPAFSVRAHAAISCQIPGRKWEKMPQSPDYRRCI